MPGIVRVKVVSARDLPIMDRSSELTDAFVELKLCQTFYRTDVCPKTLNPIWESQWFKFTVDDEDLQDEPLQLKIMDHDTYSAHDAIGKVYICLNTLVDGGSQVNVLDGWFPIFDTLHGIRGEVRVKVKLEMIRDQHPFKQSSCGVKFFACPEIPSGHIVTAIHGFVEELVVNDDPEYQWMDRIRTPRASNETRQRVFSKLSGELQRKVGLKALEAGGNAVFGYRQCFDLEGESGIVVRGIGTCVSLGPSHLSSSMHTPVQLPQAITGGMADRLPDEAGSLVDVMSPRHTPSALSSGHPQRTSSSDSDGVPSSPAPRQRTSSGTDGYLGTSSGSGGLHHTFSPSAPAAPSAISHVPSSSEFPFYTLTSLPPGVLSHIGGIVSARSVKLLDKINNPDEPETRDAWWLEVRNEVRSHCRVMGCNAVIGYCESTSICDTLCVFSATGTAVCVGILGPRPGSTIVKSTSASSDLRADAEGGEGGEGAGAGEGGGQEAQDDLPHCGVCHVPYTTSKPPFEIKLSLCAVCRTHLVPSVLLSTSEIPTGLSVRGKGCFIQARVCHPKRKIKGDENAFQVSKQLPFLEYKLHGRLLNKLHIKGMNAVFGLRIQVSIGDTMVIGVATGTGVYLEALPPPSCITVRGTEPAADLHRLSEVQAALSQKQEENRRRYGLEQPVDGIGVAGELDRSGENDPANELDISAGTKEAFVVDVDEEVLKEDLMEIVMDRSLPDGFHTSTTCMVPGQPLNSISGDSKMVAIVMKNVLNDTKQHLESQFTQLFDKLLQALAFKARRLHPCMLSDIRFDVDQPDEEEVQIAVTAMATRLGDHRPAKSQSEEFIFTMEETGFRGKSPTSTAQANSNTHAETGPSEFHQLVYITPLSQLPRHRVERYLGIINLFLIRESTSIREDGGLDAFMHRFLLEAHAIARAHVAALAGNALLSYRLNDCVLIEHPHKNQAQCLLNLSGDIVALRNEDSPSVVTTRTGSPQQPVELVPIESSPRHLAPGGSSLSSATHERTSMSAVGSTSTSKANAVYHVTKL